MVRFVVVLAVVLGGLHCHTEPAKGAAHPVNALHAPQIKALAASASVCSFTDTQNTVTLPRLFTVCFNRLVLCINNEVFSFKHTLLPHSKSQ